MKEHFVEFERRLFEVAESNDEISFYRQNDNYQVGDLLVLNEVNEKGHPTGQAIVKEITHIEPHMQYKNHVMLTIERPYWITLLQSYGYYKSMLLAKQYNYYAVMTMSERDAQQEVMAWKYREKRSNTQKERFHNMQKMGLGKNVVAAMYADQLRKLKFWESCRLDNGKYDRGCLENSEDYQSSVQLDEWLRELLVDAALEKGDKATFDSLTEPVLENF